MSKPEFKVFKEVPMLIKKKKQRSFTVMNIPDLDGDEG